MGFKLGKSSLARLEGVDERMAAVVKYAIGVTKQDFSCICGLRTIEEQRALVQKGASQTGSRDATVASCSLFFDTSKCKVDADCPRACARSKLRESDLGSL